MVEAKSPLLFINYRREDSAAAARWLWTAAKETFGPQHVFLDLEGIQSGDEWEANIGVALSPS